MTDQLLALLTSYGLPALFGALVISAVGVPLPVTLLLIAAGSFVAQGEMELWQVFVSASVGAIVGDQIGYGFGRWAGRNLIHRITDRFGGRDKIERAEALTTQWGGAGIFMSRWLVTPLGPWINITSGLAAFPWPRFIIWDALGEMLWVALYVMVGNIFSDRVQYFADLFGDLMWVIVGGIATIILGWKLFAFFRHSGEVQSDEVGAAAGSCQ